MTTKQEALATFLKCDPDEISDGYTESVFDYGNQEYMVLTDDEADEKAVEYIKETLWAFNKDFLDGYSDVISEIDDKAWSAITDRCESSNGAILAMVKDNLDCLIADAIGCDGRGHFLNTYDGHENEQDDYFIYRMN